MFNYLVSTQSYYKEITLLKIILTILCILVVSTGLFSQSPIAHYNFNTCYGAEIIDSSNGYDGIRSGATWSEGYSGQGLKFDGVDDYVSIPDAAWNNFEDNDFTIAFWVKKLAATTTFDNNSGVNKWNSGGITGTNEWALQIGKNGADTPQLVIESGSTTFAAVSQNEIALNSWQHLVGVRTGTEIKLYLNGVLESTTVVGSAIINNTNLPIYIARNGVDDNYSNALFDNIKIYDRALSASEISILAGEASSPVTCQGNYDFKVWATELTHQADWCSGTNEYTNVGTTADGQAGSCTTDSPVANVWFKFTATTKYVTVRLNHGGIRYPKLSLFTALNEELDCASGGIYSDIEVSSGQLIPGEIYYLSVDTKNYPGSFSLCLNSSPTFNYKEGAILLEDLNNWCSQSEAYTNYYANDDEESGSCTTDPTVANVWFKFQAATNFITASLTRGTIRNPKVTLWDDQGNELSCYAGGIYSDAETSSGSLIIGETYYLSIDTKNSPGTFSLCLNDQPTNNYKEGALEITNTAEWCSENQAFNNTHTTPDNLNGSCYSSVKHNVWFKFRAVTSFINIDLKRGSLVGPRMTLWDSSNNEIDCSSHIHYSDISVNSSSLTIGGWYYVSVDNGTDNVGTFDLCFDDGSYKVDWNNLVNVSVTEDRGLQKMAGASWNAGASSFNTLASNTDGWMEFKVNETGSTYMIGLTGGDPDADFHLLKYAFYITSTGQYQLRTGGNPIAGLEPKTVIPGMTFRISREGTAIRYYVDDVLEHEITDGYTDKLIVDTSISSGEHPSVNVSFDKELEVLADLSSATSLSSQDGSIGLTVSGGDEPYTYLWEEGEKTPSIFGKAIGNYSVTVTDAIGRSLSRNYYIGYALGWKNLANVNIGEDNGLIGVSGNNAWNAGASSFNTLSSNIDGSIEFVVNEVGSTYMIGLTTGDPDADFHLLKYAFYFTKSGYYQLRTNGSPITNEFKTLVPGMTFRISREGAAIRYYADGVLEHEIANGYIGDLIVDTSIATGGHPSINVSFDEELQVIADLNRISSPSAVDGGVVLTVSGGEEPYSYLWGQGETTPSISDKTIGNYSVTVTDAAGRSLSRDYSIGYALGWKNLTNVSIGEDNGLIGVSGNNAWNAGASSQNLLSSNTDGWMEFIVSEAGSTYMIGLTDGDPDADFHLLKYAFYITNAGYYQLRTNGSPITGAELKTVRPGMTFKISREGNTIHYYVDGVLEHEITNAYTGELIVDTSISMGRHPPILTNFFVTDQGIVIDQFEIQALRDLYENTNGATWTDNTGWPSTTAEWDAITSVDQAVGWHGLVISEGDVAEIQLKDNGLIGTIPSSISDLQGLKKLYLGQYNTSNSLSGNIPSTLNELTVLEYLVLAGNNLSGTIPSSIFDITTLTHCILSGNQLTGGIPENVGNAINLVDLTLASNSLTGSFPSSIWTLSKLRNLYLASNPLNTSLPEAISGLTSLSYLNLNGCGLLGELPFSLGDINTLTTIYLSHNNLEGDIPTSIINLDNLVHLFIQNNSLSGSIPEGLCTLQNLQSINLDRNELAGVVPECLKSSNSISALRLNSNNLTSLPNFTQHPNAATLTLHTQNNYIAQSDIDANLNSDGSHNFASFIYDPQNAVPADQGLVLDIAEIQALRDLYESTNGASWTNNTGWPSSSAEWDGITSVDQVIGWQGVSIFEGDITVINLSLNQLIGEMPSTIGNLTSLKNFYLHKNQLSGGIPVSIGGLTNLTHLQFQDNNLTGPIPASLGNLSSLKLLSLYNNELNGVLPMELGNLSSLETLSLHQNQFSGNIPSELGNLSNLIAFSLSSNQLTGEIPSIIGNLTTLKTLYLHKNQLSGGIPVSIGGLTNLTHLQFQDNNLTGPIPASVGNLTSLKLLSLYNNELNGVLPMELGNLSSLETLSLHQNQFSGNIPSELGNLSSLIAFSLSSNQLTGEIPSTIGNLTTLKTLYLHKNQLSGSIPVSIGGLTNLTHLQFQENDLTGSIPASVGSLTSLKLLSLYNNELNGVLPIELGNLSSLETLSLHQNQFTGAIPYELGNMSSLLAVNLGSNQLTGEIPATIGNLTALKTFYLNKNQLFGGIPVALGDLVNLTHLQLHENDLTGTIPSSLGNLSSLVLLNLYDNSFTAFPDFSNLSHTSNISINIRSNYIPQSDIDVNLNPDGSHNFSSFAYSPQNTVPVEQGTVLDIAEIQALRDLYESTNGTNWTNDTGWPSTPAEWDAVTSIDQVVGWHGVTVANSDVSTLDLVNNNLDGALPSGIGNLTLLSTLKLRDNSLIGDIPSSYNNISNVRTFHLSQNQITGEIPDFTATWTNIQALWLDNNLMIGSLEPLTGLSTLQALRLNNNQFSGDVTNVFTPSNFPELFQLYVEDNQLVGNVTNILKMTTLSYLKLYNNSFSEPAYIPTEFEQMTDLLYIDIRDVGVSGIIPASLNNNSNLYYANFSNNKFYALADISIHPNVSNLRLTAAYNYIPQAHIDVNLKTDGTHNFQAFDHSPQNTVPVEQGLVLDAGEIRALRDLYENTNGANWTNNTGWPSTPAEWDAITSIDQVVGWDGITITDGDVSELDLSSKNLSGTLPSSLNNLASLVFLRCFNNSQLQEPLPDLSSLKKLETLDFYNNSLNQLFPQWVANLTSLKFIRFDLTGIGGSLPSNIGALDSLEYLKISRSVITGELPLDIGSLTKLRHLEIFNTQLSGVIPDLSNTQLTSVLIYQNDFSGTLPEIPPSASFVYAYDNNFSGKIPDSYLVSNSQLSRLYVADNQISEIPSFIGHNKESSLQITIQNNNLTFDHIEKNLIGPDTHPFNTFTYSGQLSPSDVITVDYAGGQSISLSNEQAGGSNTSYQWQIWDGNQWNDLGSANQENYSFIPEITDDGNIYRCEMSNSWVAGQTLHSTSFGLMKSGRVLYAVNDGEWHQTNIWSDSANGEPIGFFPHEDDVVHIDGFKIAVESDGACKEIQISNALSSHLLVTGEQTQLTIFGTVKTKGSASANQQLLTVNNGAKIECK